MPNGGKIEFKDFSPDVQRIVLVKQKEIKEQRGILQFGRQLTIAQIIKEYSILSKSIIKR